MEKLSKEEVLRILRRFFNQHGEGWCTGTTPCEHDCQKCYTEALYQKLKEKGAELP